MYNKVYTYIIDDIHMVIIGKLTDTHKYKDSTIEDMDILLNISTRTH